MLSTMLHHVQNSARGDSFRNQKNLTYDLCGIACLLVLKKSPWRESHIHNVQNYLGVQNKLILFGNNSMTKK